MKRFAIPLVAAALLAFAVLVWPTRYRYEHLGRTLVRPTGGGLVVCEQPCLARIDRVSGAVEVFAGRPGRLGYTWLALPTAAQQALKAQEREKAQQALENARKAHEKAQREVWDRLAREWEQRAREGTKPKRIARTPAQIRNCEKMAEEYRSVFKTGEYQRLEVARNLRRACVGEAPGIDPTDPCDQLASKGETIAYLASEGDPASSDDMRLLQLLQGECVATLAR